MSVLHKSDHASIANSLTSCLVDTLISLGGGWFGFFSYSNGKHTIYMTAIAKMSIKTYVAFQEKQKSAVGILVCLLCDRVVIRNISASFFDLPGRGFQGGNCVYLVDRKSGLVPSNIGFKPAAESLISYFASGPNWSKSMGKKVMKSDEDP